MGTGTSIVTIRGVRGHDPCLLRTPRIVASGHPYHVRQRGNDRQAIFRNDSDSKAHDDRAGPLRRDGFIWWVRRTLDESYTCSGGGSRENLNKECLSLYPVSL